MKKRHDILFTALRSQTCDTGRDRKFSTAALRRNWNLDAANVSRLAFVNVGMTTVVWQTLRTGGRPIISPTRRLSVLP